MKIKAYLVGITLLMIFNPITANAAVPSKQESIELINFLIDESLKIGATLYPSLWGLSLLRAIFQF